MAGFFINKLSNDGTDRLNYKWMAIIMLTLVLVSFVFPLHSANQSNRRGVYNRNLDITLPSTTPTPFKLPEFDLVCWCPRTFPTSQIVYAHALCKEEFNHAVRGKNDTRVFRMPLDGIPMRGKQLPINAIDISQFAEQDKDEMSELVHLIEEIKHQNENKEGQTISEDITSRIVNIVAFETPLMFLILAMCLTIPQLIWVLLSELFCSFNVDETLKCASQLDLTIAANHQQTLGQLSKNISRSARGKSKSLGVSYLIKKVISVLVSIAFIFIVSQYCMPKVETMKEELDSVGTNLKNSEAALKRMTQSMDELKLKLAEAKAERELDFKTLLYNETKHPIMCSFDILNIQNLQKYLIQCTIVADHNTKQRERLEVNRRISLSGNIAKDGEIKKYENLLTFETTILTVAIGLFVVLIVANVLSLVDWLKKLILKSSRKSLGLSSSVTLDIVFLLEMARINSGVHVMHGLAQHFRNEGEDTEKTELNTIIIGDN